MVTKKSLWDKWVTLQRIRRSDQKGLIECEICRNKISYLDMDVGVYYKAHFPLWFLEENNYFCCDYCQPEKEKFLSVRQQLSKYGKISYDQEEMFKAETKLNRILKNHYGWLLKNRTMHH